MSPPGTKTVNVFVWLALIVLTLSSFSINETLDTSLFSAVALILVATLKGGLIMYHFMAVRIAPLAWKRLYTSWLIGVAVILALGQLAAH